MMDQMDYDPFNVTDGQTEHVYVDLYNNIRARRRLPYFGRPATFRWNSAVGEKGHLKVDMFLFLICERERPSFALFRLFARYEL